MGNTTRGLERYRKDYRSQTKTRKRRKSVEEGPQHDLTTDLHEGNTGRRLSYGFGLLENDEYDSVGPHGRFE